MDKKQLNKAAFIKAGTIRNQVIARTSGRTPRIKDYPAAISSCSIIGSTAHKEDYSRSCQNYHFEEPINSALSKLGNIGCIDSSCKNPIGHCAEPHAANKLLRTLRRKPPIRNFVFSDTIRPRTMQALSYCNNCKRTFPSLTKI